MLLIFPPAAKPCEPPAGIARIAGALKAHGAACELLDANLEGMLFLATHQRTATDTWTRRAVKNLGSNLAGLRNPLTYRSPDRYSRAIRDVNRVLEAAGREHHAILGLADYHHQQLSPVRSADLVHAAEHPEQDPFFPYFSKRLRDLLGRTPADIVGFSLNYLSQALCTFAMIGFVRKEFPKARIILGGGLVTSWMKQPGWRNPFSGLVDRLVAGPGEGPVLDLLGIGASQPLHGAPDYSSLPRADYLSPGFILPYSASSGCYWNKCSFCPEPAEGNPYHPVPVDRAITDLHDLVLRTDPALVHLLDNAVSPALLRALTERPLGVPWYGFARIERDLEDLEYCVTLRRSGCVMLKLGLESGDQGVLDRMQKGIDLASASRVLDNLARAGIAAYVYLLFGTPEETATEARRTLDFVVRHWEAISFLNLAIFNMPACGERAGEYERDLFYDGDLSLYTGFKHPQGWDRKAVRLFLEREFKKHPAVAAILRSDPPIFTSNHAPLLAKQTRG